MSDDTAPGGQFGYLLVHFRHEHNGERIYFSLSDGDDPLRWNPLFGGRAALTSSVGTTGVRDPVLARDHDGRFHILATDLRVEGGVGGWETWVRSGSRNLVVWDSDDLLTWSEPRLVEVAPPNAGMAWAPEVTRDPTTGEHIVFWSSRLYAADDPDHAAEAYSRILYTRTRDFTDFSPADIFIDAARNIIDTAILQDDGVVHRISKHEDGPGGLGIYHEVGSSLFADDFRIVATSIGSDQYPLVEGPIVFRDHRLDRWYLFLDQYADDIQGYFVMESHDIESGRWTRVPAERLMLRPGTKHGGILSLTFSEWERLAGSILPSQE
ncbi:glycoside hydrolase family 43 protein [Rathayibacter soli]|uniref:glycoside hydrolase family 43 protein n=1 Tax=Rathayibacter soli TaxID=3144168 RepID=UPI0027E48AF9|nr:glycoside hydrolase family 43 protein [Glaciibacter superstes]